MTPCCDTTLASIECVKLRCVNAYSNGVCAWDRGRFNYDKLPIKISTCPLCDFEIKSIEDFHKHVRMLHLPLPLPLPKLLVRAGALATNEHFLQRAEANDGADWRRGGRTDGGSATIEVRIRIASKRKPAQASLEAMGFSQSKKEKEVRLVLPPWSCRSFPSH